MARGWSAERNLPCAGPAAAAVQRGRRDHRRVNRDVPSTGARCNLPMTDDAGHWRSCSTWRRSTPNKPRGLGEAKRCELSATLLSRLTTLGLVSCPAPASPPASCRRGPPGTKNMDLQGVDQRLRRTPHTPTRILNAEREMGRRHARRSPPGERGRWSEHLATSTRASSPAVACRITIDKSGANTVAINQGRQRMKPSIDRTMRLMAR